jgi:hypothetical protein
LPTNGYLKKGNCRKQEGKYKYDIIEKKRFVGKTEINFTK